MALDEDYKSKELAIKRAAAEYLSMYNINKQELKDIINDAMYGGGCLDNWRQSGGSHSDPTASRALQCVNSPRVKELRKSLAIVENTVKELRASNRLDDKRRLMIIKLYYIGSCRTLGEAYMRMGIADKTGRNCHDRLLRQVARIAGLAKDEANLTVNNACKW